MWKLANKYVSNVSVYALDKLIFSANAEKMECGMDGESTIVKMRTEEKNGRRSQGTRRQQRYRAKQKLFELCELPSTAAAANQINETTANITQPPAIQVCFAMLLTEHI